MFGSFVKCFIVVTLQIFSNFNDKMSKTKQKNYSAVHVDKKSAQPKEKQVINHAENTMQPNGWPNILKKFVSIEKASQKICMDIDFVSRSNCMARCCLEVCNVHLGSISEKSRVSLPTWRLSHMYRPIVILTSYNFCSNRNVQKKRYDNNKYFTFCDVSLANALTVRDMHIVESHLLNVVTLIRAFVVWFYGFSINL